MKKRDDGGLRKAWWDDGGTLRAIPACELVPGMTETTPADADRCPRDNDERIEPDPIWPPPFDGEYGVAIRFIRESLLELCPMTVDDWADGFRNVERPADEIRRWAWLAKCYAMAVESADASPEDRRSYLLVLLSCLISTPETVFLFVPELSIRREEAQGIVDLYFTCDPNRRPPGNAEDDDELPF